MQGLMAEDLLNLTNAGGLKTQGEQSIFQIALPNSNDLNKYKWSLVKQNDKSGLQQFFTTDAYPSFALGQEPYIFFTTTNDDQVTQLVKLNTDNQELTVLHKFKNQNLMVQKVLDSNRLLLSGDAFLVKSDPDLPWHEVTEIPYWSNDEGKVNGKRHQLFIFDLKDKKLQSLVPKDFDVSIFLVSR